MARNVKTAAAEQLDLFGSHAERVADTLLPPIDFLDGHISFATEVDSSFNMRMTAKEARGTLVASAIEFNIDAIASGLPASPPATSASSAIDLAVDINAALEAVKGLEPTEGALEMIEATMQPYYEAIDAITAPEEADEGLGADDDDTDRASEEQERDAASLYGGAAAPWSDEAADLEQLTHHTMREALPFDDPANSDDVVADYMEDAQALVPRVGDGPMPYLSMTQVGHSKYATMTLDEQQQLLVQYAQTRHAAIRDRLVESNAKLVASRAAAFFRKNDRIPLEEFFQVGMIGLTEAIEKFDPSRNTRLSTYAMWYIEKNLKALGRSANHLYIPTNVFQTNENIQVRSERKAQESGGKKTAQEYVEIAMARRDQAYGTKVLSGDSPMAGSSEDDAMNLFSMIACEAMGPEERAHVASMLTLMQSAFDSASRSSARAQEPSWYADAFLLRFGLDDEHLGNPMTLPDARAVIAERGALGRYPGCAIPGTGEACRRAIEAFKENFMYHLGRHYSKDGEELPEEITNLFAPTKRGKEDEAPTATATATATAAPRTPEVEGKVETFKSSTEAELKAKPEHKENRPLITKPARTSLLNR